VYLKTRSEELRFFLTIALNKNFTYSECTKFVHFSKSMIVPYLIHSKSFFLSKYQLHGMDVSDLAIDILAEIFRQDSNGVLINIRNFVNKINQPLDLIDDKNIFFTFFGFLKKISDIRVSELYSELDPIGFKILRNIKIALPTENLCLKKSVTGLLVIFKENGHNEFLPYLNYQEFERKFLSESAKITSAKSMLEVVESLLKEQNLYRKEVYINDLVTMIKKHFNADKYFLDNENGFDDLCSDSFLEKYEVEDLFNKIIEKVRIKIYVDYFSKKKLTFAQTKAIDGAIKDIVFDLVFSGKTNSSFHEYLIKYIDVEKNEYEMKFKSKLEYIIKLVKEDFKNYLYSRK